MSETEERRSRLLEGVLAGEIAPDAAEVEALRASSPEFGRELDGLLRARALLERDFEEEREALAPGRESAPGQELVGPTLDRLAAGGPADDAPRPTRRTWLLPLAAAAAVLVGWALLGGDGSGDRDGPVPLGSGDGLRALRPVGRGQSFDRFEFEGMLDGHHRSVLRIWPKDPGPLDEPLHTETFRGHEWAAPPAVLSTLPEEIEWSVTAVSLEGDELGTARASASR